MFSSYQYIRRIQSQAVVYLKFRQKLLCVYVAGNVTRTMDLVYLDHMINDVGFEMY